ncbi:hypothetical protein B0H14DRAFT_3573556 [Mycena olivaceomarginata]|nr:hypothetical protein B0H14DRAFT_3573556 [Mycena olivaceomarginata]
MQIGGNLANALWRLTEGCIPSNLAPRVLGTLALLSSYRDKLSPLPINNFCATMEQNLWESVPKQRDNDWSLVGSAELLVLIAVDNFPPVQRPTRALVPSDWDRVLKYAHHIKSLTLNVDNNPDMGFVLRTIRTKFPQEHLLPNLTNLSWLNILPETSTISFIDLFLGPQIAHLSISSRSVLPLSRLIRTLGQRHPMLTTLNLRCTQGTAPYLNYSQWSNLVGALTRVQCLDVGVINASAFTLLAQLSCLETLEATIEGSIPCAGGGRWFPTLREIRLSTKGDILMSLTTFVQMFKSHPIKSFEVALDRTPRLQDLREFYAALTKSHLSHVALQELIVWMPKKSLAAPQECEELGKSLRAFFSFCNMRVFRLFSPAGFNIDDATITQMAYSWPRIERLDLEADCLVCPPQGTLLGLAALASHCPNLSKVQITLNTIVIPERRPIQARLELLDMGHSHIVTSSPWEFLDWLTTCFPLLAYGDG